MANRYGIYERITSFLGTIRKRVYRSTEITPRTKRVTPIGLSSNISINTVDNEAINTHLFQSILSIKSNKAIINIENEKRVLKKLSRTMRKNKPTTVIKTLINIFYSNKEIS
jgi:hypothetical protein